MINEKKNKDGIVVWRVDKVKKYYEYCIRPDSPQGKLIKKLEFKGYTKQPTSLNENGYGFARALKPLFYSLKGTFSEIESILIENNVKTEIKRIKSKIYIRINKDDYEEMLSVSNDVYQENSKRIKDVSSEYLYKLFPKHFLVQNQNSQYSKNTISKILSIKKIEDQLSIQDIQKIGEILPALMDKSISLKKEVLQKLLFLDVKKKANKIELKYILDEYERILAKKTQKESEWQTFLKKNMLIFNSSYLNLLEKENLSIAVTLPDFLLIDQFQFIDIFETKRPDFDFIMYDKSHDNYFWSSEASKAISQVEKYIFEMESNSHAIISKLKDEGIDVKIIRPRGFVLIGKRKSLNSKKMEKAFRILNSSLKNVQVILFDDFLDSIKLKYAMLK